MNVENSRFANMRIRNAHVLEMAELNFALLPGSPVQLVYPSLEPSLTAPNAPVDVVR